MFSLNQFIDYLRLLADAHKQIKTFGTGEIWEISASDPEVYPLLWCVPQDFSTTVKEATTQYSLIFADIVYEDRSNEQEILSDQQQVALDIWAQLNANDNAESFIVSPTAKFTHFIDSGTDSMAGWKVDITVRIFFAADLCAVPSTITPTPSGMQCNPVVVQNSDGSFNVTYESGSSHILPDVIIIDGNGNSHTIPSNTNYTTPACSGGGGGWTLVKNSNGTFTRTWVSGAELDLLDINLHNSDNTFNVNLPAAVNISLQNIIVNINGISQGVFPAAIDLDVPYDCPNNGWQTVKNSDDSFEQDWVSGSELDLADVDLKINGVSQGNFPAAVDLDLSYSCPPATTVLVGNTGSFGSGVDPLADYCYAFAHLAQASGSGITLNIIGGVNSGNVKVGVYSNSSATPGSLLASVTHAISPGLNSFTISVSITAGLYYWLAFMEDGGSNVKLVNTSIITPGVYKFIGYSNPLPSSFGTPDGSLTTYTSFINITT